MKLALAVALVFSLAARASAGDPPEWSTPVKPFRIAGTIYYVGTQGLAAYLIVSNQGAILLDGTTAANAALIERNIEAVGVPLRAVKRLISDHAHEDHVGALAPIKVDRVIHDGEVMQLGDVTLTAHLTPGHTPGCTSWSTTVDEKGRQLNVLFLCSITVAGNVLVGNHAYPQIAADYRASFRKLQSMKADILLPSHPDMADVLEREARREAGESDAFIDPQALPSLVAQSRAAFEAALSSAQ